MKKSKYNNGIHVVRKAEGGNYILLYCENCSRNVKWIDKKNHLKFKSKRLIDSSSYTHSNG